RRHTRWPRDWSSDVCSSDLAQAVEEGRLDLVHAVVAERAAAALTFHLSRRTIWSSLDPALAQREGLYERAVEVPSVTLAQLMSEIGRASCRERGQIVGEAGK